MVECSSIQVRISNKTLTCFGSALRQKYSSDLIKKWTHSAYCDLKMLVQIIAVTHLSSPCSSSPCVCDRLPTPSVLLSSHIGWWYFSVSVIFIVIDLQWSKERFLTWLLGLVTSFVKVASLEPIPSACRCYFFHVPQLFFSPEYKGFPQLPLS